MLPAFEWVCLHRPRDGDSVGRDRDELVTHSVLVISI